MLKVKKFTMRFYEFIEDTLISVEGMLKSFNEFIGENEALDGMAKGYLKVIENNYDFSHGMTLLMTDDLIRDYIKEALKELHITEFSTESCFGEYMEDSEGYECCDYCLFVAYVE